MSTVLVALEAVLRDLKQMGGADNTWVLGDLVALGPRPAECIQQVRELAGANVIVGNTDRYVARGERRAMQPKDEAEWQQMADTLHLTLPPERFHPAFNALDLALDQRGSEEADAQGRRHPADERRGSRPRACLA